MTDLKSWPEYCPAPESLRKITQQLEDLDRKVDDITASLNKITALNGPIAGEVRREEAARIAGDEKLQKEIRDVARDAGAKYGAGGGGITGALVAALVWMIQVLVGK